MTKVVIKNSQIHILEQKILSSELIFPELLIEAQKNYNDLPYHNYLHALCVSCYILELESFWFWKIELRSLLIAALFHDAWHTWSPSIFDEFHSLTIYKNILEQYKEKFDDYLVDESIIRKAIMWTVFKQRGKNADMYAQIMSDCDIWCIGKDVYEFIYYGFMLAFEFGVDAETFITKTEKWYFLYLMWIHKEIIINPFTKLIFPNSLKSIKDFYSLSFETKKSMFDTIQTTDITLDDFKNKYLPLI